jgi:hypothetical protein
MTGVVAPGRVSPGRDPGLLRALAGRLGRSALRHVDAAVLAVMAVVAVAPFATLFGSRRSLLITTGVAAVGALVVVACCRRLSVVSTATVAAGALAAFVVLAVFQVWPLPSVLADVWSEGTSAGYALLGAPLPAPAEPTLLTLPVVLTWVAVTVSVLIVARTRLVVLAAVPSVAALVVSLLFTGNRPPGPPVVPALLALGTLVVVLLRVNDVTATTTRDATRPVGDAPRADGRSHPSSWRFGALVIGTVVLVAVVLAAVLPLARDADRFDLHDAYEPEPEMTESVTPLALVAAGLADTGNPVLFTVTLTGGTGAPVDRIPVATLDTYDGAVWTASGRLVRIGSDLPMPAGGPRPGASTEITQEVELRDGRYRSPFLPALSWPRSVSVERLIMDRDSGALLTRARPPAGLRYQVVSDVPADAAEPGGPVAREVDTLVSGLRTVPDEVPAAIGAYARDARFSAAGGDSFAALKLIEADMRTGTSFGTEKLAVPGHGLERLRAFLDPPPATGSGVAAGRVGTAEQFASLFALIARLRGLPSRVVVGYKLHGTGGPVDVRAGDVHAWPEVHLTGGGWVRFDPTSERPGAEAEVPVPTPKQPEGHDRPDPGGAAPVPAGVGEDCAGAGCPPSVPSRSWWPIALVVLLIALPAGVVAAKALRRRRRRRGSVTRRVMGAWRETSDRLLGFGLRPSPAMTVAELTEVCGNRTDEDTAARVAEFGPVVDEVLYAEHEPRDDLARAAWDIEAGVAGALHDRANVLTRARVLLDPRPLRGVRR